MVITPSQTPPNPISISRMLEQIIFIILKYIRFVDAKSGTFIKIIVSIHSNLSHAIIHTNIKSLYKVFLSSPL